MTSELLSKIIQNQYDSASKSPNKNFTAINQNYFMPQSILNLNAEKYIPLKEKQKKMQQEFQQISVPGTNSSLISPSFSHYINPQRLIPYNDMLKKNIRSFNLLQKGKNNGEISGQKSPEDKCDLDPLIEINFKFTCDYELIENDMKDFLELFGELSSLDYDMNGNSVKVNYKYYFSAIHANYYLNFLLYENKNGNDNIFIKKENPEKKDENEYSKKATTNLDEKQNEDIIKFIKFLTDNYRNEPKNKNCENENKINEENSNDNNIPLNGDNKNNGISLLSDKKNINNNINTSNTEQKFNSNDNNNLKYLFLSQNSETPIKKTNTIINSTSENIMNHNNNNIRSEGSTKQVPQSHSYAPPLHPFNPSIKQPIVYVPFVPKMNISIPFSIPVLFPMNSPFLNKALYQVNANSKKNDNNKDESKEEKVENKISSCLVNNSTDNPINIDKNVENEHNQAQNDNKIKEFFEKMNNKIAIISNNSNNSTNSNEKMKNNEIIENSDNDKSNGSNNKTDSDIGSNNKILSNKTNSTIKTEEVNKSSNSKSNEQSDENKKCKEKNNNDIINDNSNGNKNDSNNNCSNGNSSSDKSNSFGLDVMSSLNGKTLSLERLNNFLQNSKPVTNFSNPILSLNSDKMADNPKQNNKNEISNNNNNKNNEINNNATSNNTMNNSKVPDSKNNKNLFQMAMNNNFLNSMFNFLFLSNFNQAQIKHIQKNLKPQLTNQNINNIKPNPIYFNKDVIDFNKLTLETKNKVHFMTHSSRNYCYKYVCNYTVQIENDNIFMVTKRIIGKNGCFLKKILQESCIKYGDYSTKIRLRGKGSGYVDKVSNSENNEEPLILSVSSLNYPTYYNCCLLVDGLMNKIYDDYFDHLHMILPKELHYSIHRKQLIKNEFIVDRVNSMLSFCDNKNSNNNMNEKNEKKNNDINDKCNENENEKKQEDKKVENGCCDNKK